MQFVINIDVGDLAQAGRFYTAAFGLTIGRRLGGIAVELLGGPAPIFLLAKPAGTQAAPSTTQLRTYERHWTPVHLDFVVDDIDAALVRALDAGARLEQPVGSHSWGKLALLADPFGHGFCLVQFAARGYDALTHFRERVKAS
jgi:predicted enzyme related to lactoylglutathione lyase